MPDQSKEIPQKEVLQKEQLDIAIDNVAHAYLISCVDSTYREAVSQAFAAHLLGIEGVAALQSHPDFVSVTEEKIPIDLVRSLTQTLYRKPIRGDRKIIWIANAQGMAAVAQNALLKSLEEPPAWVVWILTVDNPTKLLPTIRSRTQLHAIGQSEARSEGAPIEGLIPAMESALRGEIIGIFTNRALYDDNKDRKRDLLGQMTAYMALVYRYSVLQDDAKTPKTPLEQSAWQFRNLPQERIENIVEEIEKNRQLLEVNTNFPLAMEHLLLSLARS